MNRQLKRKFDFFSQIKKQNSRISIGGSIGLLLSISFLYYLLLGPKHTCLSLFTLLHFVTQLTAKEQLLAISVIPIYLSILVFGGGLVGALFGHYLQRRFLKDKK